MLGLLAGAGLATIAGCATGSGRGASATSTTSGPAAQSTSTAATNTAPTNTTPTSTAATAVDCGTEIPLETAGPFPGDGSNGPNALTQSGVVRSDLRASFGSASGIARGVPLTINLAVLDAGDGCAAYAGAAVYVWHCDREGRYSMYSSEVAGENYLRGVQETDERGMVSFTSIFPAAYPGRWPHVHFEVYPSLAAATSAGNKIATSQLALPEAACRSVYSTDGYGASLTNLARTSLTTDNVFRDGAARQLATVTGDIGSGLTAALSVPARA